MQKKEQLTSQSPDYTVSLFRRIGAIFYDTILIASVIFIVAQWTLVISDEAKQHVLFQIAMLTNIFGVAFLYLGWFWIHGGQTVGMKAWRITLVSEDKFSADMDKPFISWRQAFIRYIASLVSWAVLGLGFLSSLINSQKLTWHDRWSSSMLVRTR